MAEVLAGYYLLLHLAAAAVVLLRRRINTWGPQLWSWYQGRGR